MAQLGAGPPKQVAWAEAPRAGSWFLTAGASRAASNGPVLSAVLGQHPKPLRKHDNASPYPLSNTLSKLLSELLATKRMPKRRPGSRDSPFVDGCV